MATATNRNNGTCHFFRLSPELRNRIYREVLVEKEYIEDPYLPGLLQTCLQIKSEASSIYYGENRFVLRVDDLDASDLIAFCRQAEECGQTKYHLEVYLQGSEYRWPNMLRWLKAYHAGLAPSCDCGHNWESAAEACLPLAMFDLVQELDPDREMEWDKMERILNVASNMVDVGRTYDSDRWLWS